MTFCSWFKWFELLQFKGTQDCFSGNAAVNGRLKRIFILACTDSSELFFIALCMRPIKLSGLDDKSTDRAVYVMSWMSAEKFKVMYCTLCIHYSGAM